MKFKCGVCKIDTSEDTTIEIYMGMGVTQYVCVGCQKDSFKTVMKSLDVYESPAYVGNMPLEDIHSSNRSRIYTVNTTDEKPNKEERRNI